VTAHRPAPYTPGIVTDDLQRGLGFRLGAAWRRVDRLYGRALEPLGLPHAHGAVLAAVLAEPGLHAADLAQRTGFEASTVSRLVCELCRRKFLRREADPEDGRARLVFAGKRGEDLRDDLVAAIRRADDRLRGELGDAAADAIIRAADALERLP